MLGQFCQPDGSGGKPAPIQQVWVPSYGQARRLKAVALGVTAAGGCHEAFLPGQDLPVILQPVQMPSPETEHPPPCWAGGTIGEGRKVIQPRSFWPDLHQHPTAFHRSAIGCRGAPAVQLWATWTCAQQEVAGDNGIHCTRMFFVGCCAGNSDPNVAVLMSPHSSRRSPPPTCE